MPESMHACIIVCLDMRYSEHVQMEWTASCRSHQWECSHGGEAYRGNMLVIACAAIADDACCFLGLGDPACFLLGGWRMWFVLAVEFDMHHQG
jgi:hypothetical protein